MAKRRDAKKFLKAVGTRLQLLREEQKRELETVAKTVGISHTLLSRIEDGDYDMYLDLLFELCDYYGTTPHEVFKDIENI
jgi:DNA-binding XRE family transcriptional regulator